METKTKPKTDKSIGDVWPPLAHITRDDPVTDKSFAICGARLAGIELFNATKLCKKCLEIVERLES